MFYLFALEHGELEYVMFGNYTSNARETTQSYIMLWLLIAVAVKDAVNKLISVLRSKPQIFVYFTAEM